ncbi:MAG: small subunit ribosomal protein [Actinomycetota bacterium]|jgi:small subunit ribosomal protein S3|nr:small subunit ribosomal protein [Actinomycetota bacterium]
MGQKVHPYGLRLGIYTDWKSRWFSEKQYKTYLEADLRIRQYLLGQLPHAGISRIDIERTRERVRIDAHTARPGIVIGRRGSEAERLRSKLEEMESKIYGKPIDVRLNIIEVKQPELDAQLIAQGVAEQLVSRVSFRRAMKKAVSNSMRHGAKGIRVQCSGRLGGAEMSRTEWYIEGQMPLHTLRADIDYGFSEARTTFGRIGVKVWIYKGPFQDLYASARDAARLRREAALAAGETVGRGAEERAKVAAKARAASRKASPVTTSQMSPQPAGGTATPRVTTTPVPAPPEGNGSAVPEAGVSAPETIAGDPTATAARLDPVASADSSAETPPPPGSAEHPAPPESGSADVPEGEGEE